MPACPAQVVAGKIPEPGVSWRHSAAEPLGQLTPYTLRRPQQGRRNGVELKYLHFSDRSLVSPQSEIQLATPERADASFHCSFAYSALFPFRIGMSGPTSFQRAKKS
jgi:hypothetical protein